MGDFNDRLTILETKVSKLSATIKQLTEQVRLISIAKASTSMERQDRSSRQGRSRKRDILEVDDDEDVVNLVTAILVKRLVTASSKPVLPIQEGMSSIALSTITMSPMQQTKMGKLQEEVMVPTIFAMLVLFSLLFHWMLQDLMITMGFVWFARSCGKARPLCLSLLKNMVDLGNKFMNIVAFPATFFSLLLMLPPYLLFKSFLFFLGYIYPENIAGKVVLITGASSGIGEHLAYQYAKKEARLVLVARREDRLREVAERARSYGSPEVLVICGDVSKVDDCKRFVEDTVNHFGRLDHLVNNAGIASLCTFEEAPDITTYRPIMDINFWGTVYATYYATPHLRKSKGKIVGISSTVGWLPIPRMSFYCASKAALINFYECLRVELSPDVSVTIVTPADIESEMSKGRVLSKDGKMIMDPELQNVQVGMGFMSEISAEDCAKDIVKGVCRGNRYITQPYWSEIIFWWKIFFPEALEWSGRSNRIEIRCICGRMCKSDIERGMNVERCAKVILNRVCRGDQHITQPAWYKALFWWKVFVPEAIEWTYRLFLLTKVGDSQKNTLGKKMLHITGTKTVLYPETIQEPDRKAD
ncbi:hypothetical protein GIB67_009410 [Kingdonia uniflora]|uniref:Uncharacterized protein n=1 Tax=Kingdonia uniflora TaxID=39325 RepID=A0A7J7N2U2_9MAGN|nr:hypothetical protein GIB67_009410 [Kingdonia uniflora]